MHKHVEDITGCSSYGNARLMQFNKVIQGTIPEQEEQEVEEKRLDFVESVPKIFGSLVFNDQVMKERLPKDVYKAVRKTIKNGSHLELDVANRVAAVIFFFYF